MNYFFNFILKEICERRGFGASRCGSVVSSVSALLPYSIMMCVYFLFPYIQVSNRKVPRHKTEISADGKVMVENITGHPFAFSIQPNKLERTYILEAYSMLQRVGKILSVHT